MKTIARQSSVFFAGTIFTTASSYVFKIYVARKLGAETLGVFALGASIIGFLGPFADAGLSAAAGRYVAVYRGAGRMDALRGFLGRSLFLVLVLAASLSAGCVLAAGWFANRLYHTPELAGYMPLFGALLLLTTLTGFYGQVLAGLRDVARRTVITSFIASPLMIVFAVILLARGGGLRGYIVAQLASAVVTLLLLVVVARRLTPPAARLSFAPSPPLEREVVYYAATLCGSNILNFMLGQVDKVLLGIFLAVRQVGIYSIVAAMLAFVPIILQTVNQIFAPTVAELHSRGEMALIGRLYRTLTKWVLALTLPLVMVILGFAPLLMGLFGPDFVAGWPVLVIGTLGQLANCAAGSVGFLLLMSGNQRRLIRVQLVMSVAKLLFSVALIPIMGMVGAALVGALVTLGSNWWMLVEVRRVLGISPQRREYQALALPTAATAAAVLLLCWLPYPSRFALAYLGATLILTYIIFLCGMLLYGLNEDDRHILATAKARLLAIWNPAT